MTPDSASVTVRALAFVALFQAVGAVLFVRIFARELRFSDSVIRRIGITAAIVAAALLLMHQLMEAARMADDWSDAMDAELQALGWTSSTGMFHCAAVLGLLMISVGMAIRWQNGIRIALAGAALTLGAFLLTGHTSAHALRWLLAPLLGVHLLIVAFWFGALAPLYWVTRRESLDHASRIIQRFSWLAGWMVPVIAIAGIAMALVLTGADTTALTQPYGEFLLAKLAIFVLLMFVAAYNKLRLTPALRDSQHDALGTLRRTIVAEYLMIVAVLSITAALTMLYSP